MKSFFIIIIPSLVISYYASKNLDIISYTNFKDVLSSLVNISAVIFAIIGAWIAIIYPHEISRTFSTNSTYQDVTDSKANIDDIAELVRIVMISATVLVLVLGIQFTYPLFKGFKYFSIDMLYVKCSFIFVLSSITLAQISATTRAVRMCWLFLALLKRKNDLDEFSQASK